MMDVECFGVVYVEVDGSVVSISEKEHDSDPVKSCTEHSIAIQSVMKLLMHLCFISFHSINNSLVKISSSNTPSLASKSNFVRVVNFTKMIKGACLLRVWQSITSTIVSYRYITFLSVDIRSSVLTHRPKFHRMALFLKLFGSKKNIKSSNHIVVLCKHSSRPVNHRVRRGSLFTEITTESGSKDLKDSAKNSKSQISPTYNSIDFPVKAFHRLIRSYRSQRLKTKLVVPKTSYKIVNNSNFVILLG